MRSLSPSSQTRSRRRRRRADLLASSSHRSFSSEADAAAVEAFFADKDTTAYVQPLQQALDTVRSKARWLAREKDAVRAWLEKEGHFARAQGEAGGFERDSGFAA